MNGPASQVLALCFSRQGGEKARDLVAASPLARLLGNEESPEEFERKAIQLQPDILLVEYAQNNQILTDLLERLRRSVPRGSVVALADHDNSQETVLRAMRLGVREYLPEPADAGAFNDAVLRLARQTGAANAPQGRLVSVMGVKGGVGCSQVVVNLGWALSHSMGQRVALVDLDFSSGDLAVLLDMDPLRDLVDVAKEFNRLDRVLMDSLLTEVAPGLRLLAAPSDPVAAEDVSAQHVSRALDHLTDSHPLVIADLASRLSDITLQVMDRSSLVILVMEPTVPGLRHAGRLLTLCQRLGYPPEKICAVVNRDGCGGSVPRAEIMRVLGRGVTAFLPDDSGIVHAANAGRPVLRDRPRGKWSKDLLRLAGRLVEEPALPH